MKRTRFPNPRMRFHLYPSLCDKIHDEYFQLKNDPIHKSCYLLTSLSNKFNIKRKTIYNWKRKWDVDPEWKPNDTSVHGRCHRIFDDDTEEMLSSFIEVNYIDTDLYFSDESFQSLCFETLDNLHPDPEDERPNFSCSPHFIRNFKDRSNFSSRRAHFKRRPDIDLNDPSISKLKVVFQI